MIPLRLWAAAACAVLAALLVLAWLFYRSIAAAVFLLPAGAWALLLFKRTVLERRRRKLRQEFIDGMDAYISALKTGCSPENALQPATRQLRRIYGRGCALAGLFSDMQRRLSVNETLEDLFAELAERTGVAEIGRMAEIFAIARKNGGILITVLEDTLRSLRAKERLRGEIRTQLAAKRLEFAIMALTPAAMLLYMGTTAGGYLDPLYRGFSGRLVMSLLLLVYGGAVRLGLGLMREDGWTVS